MAQYIIYSLKYFSRKHACYCYIITPIDVRVTSEHANPVFSQPH